MTSEADLAEDLEIAALAAAAGAKHLASHYRSAGIRDAAESKGGRRNLVTIADRSSEDAVLAVLREHRGDDVIVAEETAPELQRGRRVWYVDPLDGTNNFAHGIPLFCVSVGLVVDGRPRVGVIDAPVLGEHYSALIPDDGDPVATAATGPVHVSSTDELADAVLATGFAYDRDRLADHNFGNFREVAMRCRGMRRGGSAALDLAWVAAGRFDGFWELHLNPWDIAAGAALIRAAGGRVTDMVGGDDWLVGGHLAATNGRVHEELLGCLERPSFVA